MCGSPTSTCMHVNQNFDPFLVGMRALTVTKSAENLTRNGFKTKLNVLIRKSVVSTR
jgi:hypothetical protein